MDTIFVNDQIVSKYHPDLLDNRYMVEGNLVGCLWKNPELYIELKNDLTMDDFITGDGLRHFRIGQMMVEQGFKVFDELAFATFLKDKPTLSDNINFAGMFQLMSVINMDNFDAYHDEFIKHNILLKLHDKGFNVVENLHKFKNVTSELVYQYFDFILSDTFVKKQLGVKIVDLSDGYDDYLKMCDSGQNLGYSIASTCPKLNKEFAGIHRQNVLLHTAHSGKGKTSSCLAMYVLPLLEQGEKICILANEQTINDFRGMLLPTVINNKIKQRDEKGFARNRLSFGGFTDDEWDMLKAGQAWLEQYKSQLFMAELNDYSTSTLKKMIKKFKAIGVNIFLYDTAKPEDESDAKAYAEFVEQSKELYQIARQEDVALIVTAQLSLATSNVRYLDASCLAKAKAIKEVASQILMIRDVFPDEYTGENKDLKCYYWDKNPITNEWEKRQFVLDKDKQYSIMQIDKNRFGKDGLAILFEKHMDYNTWIERAYVGQIARF